MLHAVTFAGFLDSYLGPWTQRVLDTIGTILNPDGVTRETLLQEDAELQPPVSMPDNLCSAESLPGLLLDVHDRELRIRCALFEVVGCYHMRPHLHHIEQRRRGIIFEAHDAVELHRATNLLFTQPEAPFHVDEVREYDEQFGLGLDGLLRYAGSHELEDFAVTTTGEIMGKYEWYYWKETQEWFDNPAKRLAGCGSHSSGPKHAKYLHDLRRPEIRAQLARWLHCTAAEVGAALKAEGYNGPLRVFIDNELWRQLGIFASQDLPLHLCPGIAELRKLLLQHYTPVLISNVWLEELVKHWKHLSPQARAHPVGAEVRLRLHNRTRPDPMGPPTMVELKEIRHALLHHLPDRSLLQRRLPLVLVEEMVWEGAEDETEDGISERGSGDSNRDSVQKEESENGEEAEEGEEGEGDEVDPNTTEEALYSYKMPELKHMLRARTLAVSGLKSELIDRLLAALALELQDEVEGDDEDADESDEAALQQLRDIQQPVALSDLIEGRAFFAWNEVAQLSFYPLVCMQDHQKHQPKIQVACLVKGNSSIYTIDPRWQGLTDADRACNSLIFQVPGERFTEITGGVAGQRAWQLDMM